MNSIAETKGQNDFMHKAVKYLEEFSGGNISIGGVIEKRLEDFQNYLLKDSGLAKKTISHYSGAVRQALRKATRDRIIPRNPALGVKGVSVPEGEVIYLTVQEVEALAKTQVKGELGAEIRKTFAVLSLESGVEIYTLSKLLDHASVKTTQIYAKATDKMKREAVDALPTIDIKAVNK